MTRLVGELDDLILYRRAVAGTDSLDLAAVERRARDGLSENPARFVGGVADVALDLGAINPAGQERERRGVGVAGLRLEMGPVDGAAVQARRRAGLEPGPVQAERAKLVAQQLGGRLSVAAATVPHLANVGQTVQESSCGDDHRLGIDGAAVAQLDPSDAAVLDRERGDLGLLDAQVGFLLEHLAHARAVEFLVHLRARGPDGGSAAGIEQAELDADRIGDFGHDAAEGVDFADEVTFGDASDGGVAGHLRDEVQVHGDHGGAESHAGAGSRGFATGVAGADDHDLVAFGHCYHCTGPEQGPGVGGQGPGNGGVST